MGDQLQERDDSQYTNSAQVVITRKVQGDTNNRYQQKADGSMQWGSGSATPDVGLSRSGAGVLSLDTGTLQANPAIVAVTASTLTLAGATHGGAIVTLSRAAGITVTLPAATGSGNRYELINLTTVTSNNHVIQVANASDYMIGMIYSANDTDASSSTWETANTGTVATETDTITLNGTTKGGIKGDRIILTDVAANVWQLTGFTSATGSEATPLSAAV